MAAYSKLSGSTCTNTFSIGVYRRTTFLTESWQIDKLFKRMLIILCMQHMCICRGFKLRIGIGQPAPALILPEVSSIVGPPLKTVLKTLG